VNPRRIAVVGGGISGLTAAYHLARVRKAGAPIEEHVFEASPRLGGVIHTEHIDGCVVEAGPDAFLTEKREALDLCEQLALVPQLVGSQDDQRRTYILHKGKLVPLPDGFEFMVPARPFAVLSTPLLSLRDKLALAAEPFMRPRPHPHDESVAAFVLRHFGPSLLNNIVDPLLTAVYGGDARRLSAPAVLPRMLEIEQKYGSLVRGMRRAAATRKKNFPATESKTAAPPPIFTSIRNGLQTLVDALLMDLESTRLHCDHRVLRLSDQTEAEAASSYALRLEDREPFRADAVILALPAYWTAKLVRDLDITLAETLTAVHYSSSLIVALGYETEKLDPLPAGFGFLVPPSEPYRIRACTFVGQKFPARVPPERILLRCFLGGMRDEAVLDITDKDALSTVREELKRILGISAEPLFSRVYRWPKAMAQYTVGHHQRLQTIQQRTRRHPRLYLCGNAYEGIGIPDCIRSGRKAAEECLQQFQEA
jgi:oxygen-dependent protoporphyrinogen oxidase